MISAFDHVLRHALGTTVKGVVRIYQRVISPVIHSFAGQGYGCRFVPSCSEYVLEAVDKHGPWVGGRLGMRRLCSCHPLGRSGWDPVPNQPRVKKTPSLKEFVRS